MTRNITIASRIREVFLNGHWIANTNYKEQFQQVDGQQAIRKVGYLNTIAALTYHINYYLKGLFNTPENDTLEFNDKYGFDLPEIQTENDWKEMVDDFLATAVKFANTVEQMEDGFFDTSFIEEKYGTWLRNIGGVIEHSYYHLGQIVILKKI